MRFTIRKHEDFVEVSARERNEALPDRPAYVYTSYSYTLEAGGVPVGERLPSTRAAIERALALSLASGVQDNFASGASLSSRLKRLLPGVPSALVTKYAKALVQDAEGVSRRRAEAKRTRRGPEGETLENDLWGDLEAAAEEMLG
jgi:hypothetical protein